MVLMLLHLGGNFYFAFLITGSPNFEKEEEILSSKSVTTRRDSIQMEPKMDNDDIPNPDGSLLYPEEKAFPERIIKPIMDQIKDYRARFPPYQPNPK